MNRLTKRIREYVYYTQGTYENTLPAEMSIEDIRKILCKLAEYEDTGLEPKEIAEVQESIDPIPFGRFHEIMEAEREGRTVVLPCKTDSVIYQLRKKNHACGPGVSPRRVIGAFVYSNGDYALEHQGMMPCTKQDFNKTWFLTREEAEAALEEKE